MPVERIYGASPPYMDEDGEIGEAVSIIEVRWGHHHTPVEIATKCVRRDDGTDYYPPLQPIEWEVTATEGVHAEVGTGTNPIIGELLEAEGLRSSGYYADFDRQALNQLIRVLRRARDAEYGKDE